MSDSGKTVLIVDDDVDFAEANRVALEARGFTVLTATDSRLGVEMALEKRPDLILMDLMMEKVYAGFSAVETLRAHEETSEIPIIMVSSETTEIGFRVDQEGEKPQWLHVREFINKPVNPIELAEKVAGILG